MITKEERVGRRRVTQMGARAGWARWFTGAGLALISAASILQVLRIGQIISAWPAETAAMLVLGWAGVAALAGRKAILELWNHLDMLKGALDLTPDAQLI